MVDVQDPSHATFPRVARSKHAASYRVKTRSSIARSTQQIITRKPDLFRIELDKKEIKIV